MNKNLIKIFDITEPIAGYTVIRNHYWSNSILAFKTKELRDQFLKNFSDLIEIAKPLL
jgi:hypothetical protein